MKFRKGYHNNYLLDEGSFLQGPRDLFKEILFTFKVQYYFINALRKSHFMGPCVTVFGSARFDENNFFKKRSRRQLWLKWALPS
jgi:hypothetical protein